MSFCTPFLRYTQKVQCSANSVQLAKETNRDLVKELLLLDKYIDIVIPRGGKSLIERISKDSKIQVIKHLDGICHVYIDEFADKKELLT